MQQIAINLWRQGRKGVVFGIILATVSILAGITNGGGVILLLLLVPGYAVGAIFFLQSAFRNGAKTLAAWTNLFTFNLTLLSFVAAAFILIAGEYVANVGFVALLKQIYIGHR